MVDRHRGFYHQGAYLEDVLLARREEQIFNKNLSGNLES